VAEEEAAVKEEAKPESESAVEVPKAVEETPAVVEEKESTPEVSVILIIILMSRFFIPLFVSTYI